MNRNDTPIRPSGANGPHIPPYEPIEPGADSPHRDQALSPLEEETDRSGFILFLGIISLFLCGPLGVIAWVMAGSDLRKIRNGRLSSRKAGVLRVGRALGITGTAIFVMVIVSAAVVLQRNFADFRTVVKSAPLRPDEIAFAGEWRGRQGTVIRIQADGRGDFRSQQKSVTGGRVRIEGDSLSIGIMGLRKTWHIDVRPHLQNGDWSMQLDGEVFFRKADGQIVLELGNAKTSIEVRGCLPYPTNFALL
jgi:hypothetical protein